MPPDNRPLTLVCGASGFVGAHVIRELAEKGRRVRAFARATSNCALIDGLPVERAIGDIQDEASLRAAMQGVDVVYHCIVNAKAWLRDRTPFYQINVEGLRRTLRIAEQAGVRRFVLTSSYATIAPRRKGLSTEADFFSDWSHLPPYLQSRIEAERLFFDFIRDSPMEGVAVCPGTTFGANDLLPTPQGQLIHDVIRGRMPFYWDGGTCSLGIVDTARGMVLAAERGASGERYILSERWVSYKELFETAARYAGRKPRLLRFPSGLMRFSARVTEWLAARLNIENRFNMNAIRCSNELSEVSIDKARHELGWQPRPVWDAVHECVEYFQAGQGHNAAASFSATRTKT